MKNLELPPAPADQVNAVKAWVQPVTLPTYEPMAPDKNPMFLETRVYQGSSGGVYPLPFIDRIATEARERSWNALHIENEFLRVMILPEIGGRIHVGLDKTNGYDFFYRQNVIKPALVGLAGPWISGGVEFNWPQHHRPATFMPVQFRIEHHVDGSSTIWCGDHDPMNRLRGEHGVCLYPGRAVLELKVRLYNRTPFTQTFLWWANAGVHVHEHYQSFFPPDVQFVSDHARRAMSTFPLCAGHYYGVDYASRARDGVPSEEKPPEFLPPGNYPPHDLSWYANIPVPTSYMTVGSKQDFVGGYDHLKDAGLVHVANHHIAPGKKQWTWGNHEFGYAWDRNLTDSDGPYVELMAGVYTDNQPDFSFIAPGETKTFRQYWYPIQKIGPAQNTNADAAISLTRADGRMRVGVYLTRLVSPAIVRLERKGEPVAEWLRDLGPGAPLVETVPLPQGTREPDLKLSVKTKEDRELISYQPQCYASSEIPAPAVEPLLPEQIKTADELYITGLHLAQYRHATRHPDIYWREALRRDPTDTRCNNALGLWHLHFGEFVEAEKYFRKAIAGLTRLNANPYDGEPFYNLGLTLRFLGKVEQAYDNFYKATWNYAWRAPSFYAITEIDCCSGDWENALEHAQFSIRSNADHVNVRNLLVLILRELGRKIEAEELLEETLKLDPLDCWSQHLAGQVVPADNQLRLDIAFDYMRAGFFRHAVEVLEECDHAAHDGSLPMLLYALAHIHRQLGNEPEAQQWYRLAAGAGPDYCFPNRLEEMLILEAAIHANPSDARACYYLGNIFYDRRRHREAMSYWERAAELDPTFPTVWRNLGIGYFNVLHDVDKAKEAFGRAIGANPSDARVFYERDQLWKRTGTAPQRRLEALENRRDLVAMRDDLSIELAALYNQTDQPEKALAVLQLRKFQPWEGGEGLALKQHVRTHLVLGRRALLAGQNSEAVRLFTAALDSPSNLGEARHLFASQNNIYYWLGSAHEIMGDEKTARSWWCKAADKMGDFQEMSVRPLSEMTYYSALALKRLGENARAERLLEELLAHAKKLTRQEARIDYFATSLPSMLLFEDDLESRQKITATFLRAQALLGLGNRRQGRRLLSRISRLDPNHAPAMDLSREIDCEARLRQPETVGA